MALGTIDIEPSILIWARKTLGLSIEEVAARLKREPQEIASWETGKGKPSFAQLEKLAEKIYKRPLALFFLKEPPKEEVVQFDFRTMGSDAIRELSANTRIELRKAKALQKSLTAIHGKSNPRRGLIDIHFPDGQKVVEAIAQVRSIIGLTEEEQGEWSSNYDALNQLRSKIEVSGIFVFQFSLKDIRGFALYDDEFPVIGLSSKDLPQGRLFTLLHELCHLLFNDSDIFLNPDMERIIGGHKETERVCNKFAADFLLPERAFNYAIDKFLDEPGYVSDNQISRIARKFHVGRIVIVRKLKEIGWVDQDFYLAKQKLYALQYKGQIDAKKNSTQGGGPSHYITKVSKLGRTYLNDVFNQMESGSLSPLQVTDLIGVKVDNFPKFIENIN